jgi:hypothetical protein
LKFPKCLANNLFFSTLVLVTATFLPSSHNELSSPPTALTSPSPLTVLALRSTETTFLGLPLTAVFGSLCDVVVSAAAAAEQPISGIKYTTRNSSILLLTNASVALALYKLATVIKPSVCASKTRAFAGLASNAVLSTKSVALWMEGEERGSRRSRRRFMLEMLAKREREGGWRRRIPWRRVRVERRSVLVAVLVG